VIKTTRLICILFIFLVGCTIKQTFDNSNIQSIEYHFLPHQMEIDNEKKGEKLESVECPEFRSGQLDLNIVRDTIEQPFYDNPYSYYVLGTISDPHSKVTINGNAVNITTEGEYTGTFHYDFYVDNGATTICIIATSPEGKKVSWNQTLVIDGDLLKTWCEEELTKTDPLKADSDGDGILDHDEDFDNDKSKNFWECQSRTDPYNADSDGDTLSDGVEEFG